MEVRHEDQAQIEQGQKMFEEALARATSRLGKRISIKGWDEDKEGRWVHFVLAEVDGKLLRGPEIPVEHLEDAPRSREIRDWFEAWAEGWLMNPEDREYAKEKGPFTDPALN